MFFQVLSIDFLPIIFKLVLIFEMIVTIALLVHLSFSSTYLMKGHNLIGD